MPVFRARTRVEILRDMVARTVARSRLSGLIRDAAVYHILAASADELAEGNFQMATLRKLFSIDDATGTDLDERMRDIQPGTVQRIKALYANGNVRFSRPGIVGVIPIPVNTLVGAQDALGVVRFKTTAPGSILGGNTLSGLIPIVAIDAGKRGNVADNTILKMLSRIAGVTGVTNPAATVNGYDRELDPAFRARGKAFVRSLARGTIVSLQTAAKNTRLTDGSRVVFAKVSEDAFLLGRVYLFVDDATGTTDTFSTAYVAAYDTFLPVAVGGERRLFTTQKPIRDDGGFVFEINGVPQVRGTTDSPGIDYILNPASGQITLTTSSYPTGLTPGDIARAKYRYYTRLIQEAQKIIDGDPSNAISYPGVRAGGVLVLVLPPQTLAQTVAAGIVVAEGFDPLVVAALVKTAIQNYINGLDIGDDVIVAKLYEVAMEVPGMADILISDLSGSSPPVNQVVQEYQVARIAAGDISLI